MYTYMRVVSIMLFTIWLRDANIKEKYSRHSYFALFIYQNDICQHI